MLRMGGFTAGSLLGGLLLGISASASLAEAEPVFVPHSSGSGFHKLPDSSPHGFSRLHRSDLRGNRYGRLSGVRPRPHRFGQRGHGAEAFIGHNDADLGGGAQPSRRGDSDGFTGGRLGVGAGHEEQNFGYGSTFDGIGPGSSFGTTFEKTSNGFDAVRGGPRTNDAGQLGLF